MRAKGPGESALLLLDVIDVLDTVKVHYALVGAMAASVHGVVRASIDADAILFTPPPQSLKDMAARLHRAGLRTKLTRGGVDDPIRAVLSISDTHTNKVDLLMGLRNFPADALQRRKRVPFLGSTLFVVGLEDFIAMKLFAGGPKDIDDVKNILITQASRLDQKLLLSILKHFGSEPLSLYKRLSH